MFTLTRSLRAIMLRTTIHFSLLAIALVAMSAADGREIKTVKFEVLPSSSVALQFEARKVEWVLGKVRIEGTVTNTGPDNYKWGEVIYTARDRNRNVLGREIWHVSPFDLDSGMQGEVDGDLIYTKGRIPAIIQVDISGDLP